MIDIFDPYELRARILPALVVVSPLVFPGLILIQAISPNVATSTLAGFSLLPLVYVLSLIVRNLGKAKEPQIWAFWGGAPSVRFMRANDSTFSSDIKHSIAKAVKQRFSITFEDPHLSVEELDQRLEDAFRLVRQRVRQIDPQGLWYKHNAEYGFLRNLYASCGLWAIFGALVAVSGGVLFYTLSDILYAAVISLGILFVLLAWGLYQFVLPGLLRTAADRHAEMTWMSFLNIESDRKS